MEAQQNHIIRLNVGGVIHTTTRMTLCTYPESMLGAMFSGDFGATMDENGHYFIDRDGEIFKHVLNFLRSNRITLPEDFTEWDLLLSEADFYQIQPMINALKSLREERLGTKRHGDRLTLEILEVRVEFGYISFVYNSMNSDFNLDFRSRDRKVKTYTVAMGRKDVLLSFPSHFALQKKFSELKEDKMRDYGELTLNEITTRLQVMSFLRQHGWTLEKTEMSSSSVAHDKDTHDVCIEHSVREVWTKNE